MSSLLLKNNPEYVIIGLSESALVLSKMMTERSISHIIICPPTAKQLVRLGETIKLLRGSKNALLLEGYSNCFRSSFFNPPDKLEEEDLRLIDKDSEKTKLHFHHQEYNKILKSLALANISIETSRENINAKSFMQNKDNFLEGYRVDSIKALERGYRLSLWPGKKKYLNCEKLIIATGSKSAFALLNTLDRARFEKSYNSRIGINAGLILSCSENLNDSTNKLNYFEIKDSASFVLGFSNRIGAELSTASSNFSNLKHYFFYRSFPSSYTFNRIFFEKFSPEKSDLENFIGEIKKLMQKSFEKNEKVKWYLPFDNFHQINIKNDINLFEERIMSDESAFFICFQPYGTTPLSHVGAGFTDEFGKVNAKENLWITGAALLPKSQAFVNTTALSRALNHRIFSKILNP